MKPTTAEMRALKRRDPVLAKAMKHGLPPFPDFPVGKLRGSHFHALARSIIYQQLATAVAATIYGVGALIQRGGRAVAGMLTIATAGGS